MRCRAIHLADRSLPVRRPRSRRRAGRAAAERRKGLPGAASGRCWLRLARWQRSPIPPDADASACVPRANPPHITSSSTNASSLAAARPPPCAQAHRLALTRGISSVRGQLGLSGSHLPQPSPLSWRQHVQHASAREPPSAQPPGRHQHTERQIHRGQGSVITLTF